MFLPLCPATHALYRSIQEDVLAAAKARAAQPDAAPAALAACRALAAALPPVAWAARPREMCGELTTHTLAALWAKFPEVCASAGARCVTAYAREPCCAWELGCFGTQQP